MHHDDLSVNCADEEYPDVLRRIAGVFGRREGRIQLSKNGNIVELAKFVRGQVRQVSLVTKTNNKREQVQVVLHCLEYLQSEAGQQKLVYCVGQKVWSLEKGYILSQKTESRRIMSEMRAANPSKPRRIKRSRRRRLREAA